MRRTVAQSLVLSFLVALGASSACSNDADSSNPSAGTSGDAGESAGGTSASAGSPTTEGGAVVQATGGAAQAGGAVAQGGTAATSTDGGAAATNQAGTTTQGGAGSPAAGGAGPEPLPGPPDLITSSGGPWPDSLTGACWNTTKLIPCPQKDDAFFGQDGTYRINVPSYTSNASTLTDKITGLMWQLVPDAAEKTQAEAVAYCDNLDVAGHTDWRLPTRLEYVSVLDEGMGNGSGMPPAVPRDTLGAHWTASAAGTGDGVFFLVNDSFALWTIATGTIAHAARCVRGTPLSGSLTLDTDVVTDSMTGLAWQATALDDTLVTWQAALAYCEGLSHAGKDDWRLPSIKEFATIVDEAAQQAPVISTDFGDAAAAHYWSSTPLPSFGSEHYAAALDTSLGISPSLKMIDAAAAARCVRTAN